MEKWKSKDHLFISVSTQNTNFLPLTCTSHLIKASYNRQKCIYVIKEETSIILKFNNRLIETF